MLDPILFSIFVNDLSLLMKDVEPENLAKKHEVHKKILDKIFKMLQKGGLPATDLCKKLI